MLEASPTQFAPGNSDTKTKVEDAPEPLYSTADNRIPLDLN